LGFIVTAVEPPPIVWDPKSSCMSTWPAVESD
jgi:hypothetical protein